MKEETWQSKLWKLIETWADNQEDRKTAHLATSDYNKIEEFIQGMLDEKDTEIKNLEREISLLKDETQLFCVSVENK